MENSPYAADGILLPMVDRYALAPGALAAVGAAFTPVRRRDNGHEVEDGKVNSDHIPDLEE